MLETYLQYFDSNYNGNRAPLHIGHHFSLWNGGAYWEAMKEFALTVCKKPEVVCGTYKELADFMDKTPPETVRAYREGRFAKAQSLRLSQGLPVYDLGVRIAQNGEGYAATLSGRDTRDRTDLRVEYRVDGKRVSGKQIRSGDFRGLAGHSTAKIEARVFKGLNEVARATQVLSQLGEANEILSETPIEARALLGDLPEAHAAEGEGLHHGH
jgi:hypothetical protein